MEEQKNQERRKLIDETEYQNSHCENSKVENYFKHQTSFHQDYTEWKTQFRRFSHKRFPK